MSSPTLAATLVGTTGLVGTELASILSRNSSFGPVSAFSRRPVDQLSLPASVDTSRLSFIVEKDSTTWPSKVPNAPIFFSALATTAAVAGGAKNQYAIDFTLNRDLAVAAKAAGCRVYVVVSAAGADAKSWFHYPRMKGELDDAVSGLGFDHTIILRPSIIMGNRGALGQPSRLGESVATSVIGGISTVLPFTKKFLSNQADAIAAAAVAAVNHCEAGTRPDGKKSGVWILGPTAINALAAESTAAGGATKPSGDSAQ